MISGSRVRSGVFQSAYELMSSPSLDESIHAEFKLHIGWFEENLRLPPRISFSKRDAICWFKEESREHIRRLWSVVALLDDQDRRVRLLTARRPGYKTYEDRHQVVAVPFSDML